MIESFDEGIVQNVTIVLRIKKKNQKKNQKQMSD